VAKKLKRIIIKLCNYNHSTESNKNNQHWTAWKQLGNVIDGTECTSTNAANGQSVVNSQEDLERLERLNETLFRKKGGKAFLRKRYGTASFQFRISYFSYFFVFFVFYERNEIRNSVSYFVFFLFVIFVISFNRSRSD